MNPRITRNPSVVVALVATLLGRIAGAQEPLPAAYYTESLRGLYVGIGAGITAPVGGYGTAGYTSSWAALLPAGVDIVGSPFGVRVDATYARLAGQSLAGVKAADLGIWSFNGDVKLRAHPRTWGPVNSAYVLGGLGAFRSDETNATTHVGWNAGVGLAFRSWRKSRMFVESRYLGFGSGGGQRHLFLPVIFGLSYYSSERPAPAR